jgi:hypothetical protein
MEDPDDTTTVATRVHDGDIGFNEAGGIGVATMLFHSPIANVGQEEGGTTPSPNDHHLPGKRTKLLLEYLDSQCA